MANNRKLQSEIDRLLKKVSEGIEVYDEVYEKFEEAPSQALKERFEGELKKEIKKLQRLREQIKSLVCSSEVKDKKSLEQHRKRIEEKMEAFKVTERETKTKAFSKEGLANAAKFNTDDTPQARTEGWLKTSIADAAQQIETTEFELQSDTTLIATSSRKRNSGSGSREDPREVRVKRLKITQARLEQLLRMVVNEDVVPEEVDDVEDLVQEFLCNSNEEAYEELEEQLKDFDLAEVVIKTRGDDDDDEDAPATTPSTATATASLSPSSSSAAAAAAAAGGSTKGLLSPATGTRPTSSSGVRLSSPPTLAAGKAAPQPGGGAVVKKEAGGATPALLSTVGGGGAALSSPALGTSGAVRKPGGAEAAPTTPAGAAGGKSIRVAELPGAKVSSTTSAWKTADSVSVIAGTLNRDGGDRKGGTTSTTATGPSHVGGPSSLAVGAVRTPSPAEAFQATSVASARPPSSSVDQRDSHHAPASVDNDDNGDYDWEEIGDSSPTAEAIKALVDDNDDMMNEDTFGGDVGPATVGSLSDMANATNRMRAEWDFQQGRRPDGAVAQTPTTTATATAGGAAMGAAGAGAATGATDSGLSDAAKRQAGSVQPPRPQGEQPKASAKTGSLHPTSEPATSPSSSRTQEDKQQILRMLRMSLSNLPHMQDVERPRAFDPPNPLKTPAHYPQVVLPGLTQPFIYKRFDLDTLFFIFYYQQRSYQQYYAAKQLKENSFRFHTTDKTWYQRYTKPTSTLETSETGSFVYFDYKDTWKRCIRESFTFEYSCLEDELE